MSRTSGLSDLVNIINFTIKSPQFYSKIHVPVSNCQRSLPYNCMIMCILYACEWMCCIIFFLLSIYAPIIYASIVDTYTSISGKKPISLLGDSVGN